MSPKDEKPEKEDSESESVAVAIVESSVAETDSKTTPTSLLIPRIVSVDTSRSKTNAEVVRMCVQKLGWKDYPEGHPENRPCDIYWHNLVYPDMKEVVAPGAKVNKLPGMNELSRKIHLSRTLGSLQRIYPTQFDFYPKSWFIPAQLDQFREDYQSMLSSTSTRRSRDESEQEEVEKEEKEQEEEELPWFIVKPDEGAQGCGIYLINSPEQLKKIDQPQLVQPYIAQPYLLQKYRMPSTSNSDQVFMHLTNFSLNKTSTDYVHSNDLKVQGNKRLLSTVFHQLESARGVNTRKLWQDIKLIITKTVLAMVPELTIRYENQFRGPKSAPPGPSCFHILGFDILLTHDLQPILLEINACPSLTLSQKIKSADNKENRVLTKLRTPPPRVNRSIPRLSRATTPTSQQQQQQQQTRVNGMTSAPLGDFRAILKPLSAQATIPKRSKSGSSTPRVTSVVDEAIKVPLVRDTLLLVTDQLPTLKQSSLGSIRLKASDDSEAFINRKPSLTEIFPARISNSCAHLLILDQAAHLYMKIVPIRRTLLLTASAFRNFIRKCQLGDIMTRSATEAAYQKVVNNFAGQQLTEGIPFHGFIDLLMQLSRTKFPEAETPSEALKSMVMFCQTKLRHSAARKKAAKSTKTGAAAAAGGGALGEAGKTLPSRRASTSSSTPAITTRQRKTSVATAGEAGGKASASRRTSSSASTPATTARRKSLVTSSGGGDGESIGDGDTTTSISITIDPPVPSTSSTSLSLGDSAASPRHPSPSPSNPSSITSSSRSLSSSSPSSTFSLMSPIYCVTYGGGGDDTPSSTSKSPTTNRRRLGGGSSASLPKTV